MTILVSLSISSLDIYDNALLSIRSTIVIITEVCHYFFTVCIPKWN